MPALSIITVAYNAADTIADTMASVAAQTDTDHEHLLIDGASTDATVAIARHHATPRTRIISEPDAGLYDAMNTGIAQAKGRYIGFLNADDFFVRRDATAIIGRAIGENPDAVSAAVAIVDQQRPDRWIRSYSATHFRPWMLRFGHMPPHPGFYARRSLFTELGGFNTGYRIMADYDWMVRFHQSGRRARAVRETLVALRDGGASNSGLDSRRTIAREALASLHSHGVPSHAALMWAKYLAKSAQLVVPPFGFPAPSAVAWTPKAGDTGSHG